MREITREEIDEKYKWDLTSLYKNEEEYNNDKSKLLDLINEIINYEGKITSSSNTLYNFLKLEEEIGTILSNMFLYASCKLHEDLNNQENQKRYSEICNIDSMHNEKTSFIMPELFKTNYDDIKKMIESDSNLKEFEIDLNEIYKYQKYTLSDNEEKLLSNISDLQSVYENNFEIILNTLVDFGTIKDENDEEVKLTIGNYSKFIRSKNRRVRKDAYINRGEAIKKYANLISTDYEANVKADSMIAKARGYNSNIQMHLFPDGVDEEIYDNLLSIAKKNINSLYKYYEFIKNESKLDEIEVYDLLTPLIENDKKYTPEDAKKIICDALSCYGEEYISVLNKAFDDRWIDFYPNKGKKSGYYENMAFTHPIVLANYNDDYISLSSLAHELGHALHSYYSSKNNPNHLSMYSIFVAEVASLTNEILLSNYIINNSNDKNEKLDAILKILEIFSSNFFGTLSEGSIFEKEVHERIFNGETLGMDDFNNIYQNISNDYYGDIVKQNEYIKYNWARVPHFYTSFYYYKYSIGVSCACFVANKILIGDKEYLNKYINFLSLGGSKMPLDELKTIDIDLSKEDVINEAIKYFDSLIDKYIEIKNN